MYASRISQCVVMQLVIGQHTYAINDDNGKYPGKPQNYKNK